MSSQKKHPLITGTVILTLTGLITRVMGFFYRIFLSHTIGAEGVGIYQLIFPVYALCFSFAVAGIQTGISRCCASALAQKNPAKARSYFSCGFFLSFSLSVIAAALLHRYAGFLSRSLLKEPRCTPLLQLVAWSVPLGTVHTCVSAWFFARKQTAVPSVSQFLEQGARIFSSVFFYLILSEKGIAPTPLLAAAGLLAGELVASLFSAICLLFHFQGTEYKTSSPLPVPSYAACAGRLVALSLPLTVNRILLNLLQSGEAILIPSRLRQYGCSSFQALSIYGILTGMALPFILFPSAITNSVSTMLLPTIAQEQAKGNRKKIISATEKTMKYCLLLGIFAGGIFFFFGNLLGTLVYGNQDAGTFIQILSFLCPFLYLTGTLSSILNGLGHTSLCFFQNVVGLSIRIFFILFAVPRAGIQGYLWGLLVSQLVTTLLNLFFLHQKVSFSFYPLQWLFLPLAFLVLSCGMGLFVFYLCDSLFSLPGLWNLGITMGVCGISYLTCLLCSKQIHISS